MTLSEILRQAFATFRAHKMRTFLTMFGIVWGIASVIIPLTLAIVYLVLIVLYFAKSPGGFGTLAQVAQLFQNAHGLAECDLHVQPR